MPFPNYRVQLITPSFKSNVPQNESGNVLHSGDLYNLTMNESTNIFALAIAHVFLILLSTVLQLYRNRQ
jgi:hypothetical protein